MRTRRSRWGLRGGTQILFLICCPVLLAGVALTVDIGSLYITRQALQNGVDAAAKSGGLELPEQQAAIEQCKECATQNNLDTSEGHLFIRVLDGQGQVVDGDDNDSPRRLEVRAVKDVTMTFARIFGIEKWPVGARAVVAMTEEPVNVITRNTTPFGLDKDVYDAVNDVNVVVVPCEPAEGQENQQLWIIPGHVQPNDVADMMTGGNPNGLYVDQAVTANPSTRQFVAAMERAMNELIARADQNDEYLDPDNHNSNNPRILHIPLVEKLDGSAHGRDTHNVRIAGFASFYVFSLRGSRMTGRFVDTGSTDGQVDDTHQPSEGDGNGTIREVRLIE